MSIRDRIRAEIDTWSDDQVAELYEMIRQRSDVPVPSPRPGILAKLRTVVIDGPPDLAANLDLYMSGEKRVEPNVP